jgi:hypothetical protein
MIGSLTVLELQRIPAPFDDPHWVFEIEFNRFRARPRTAEA